MCVFSLLSGLGNESWKTAVRWNAAQSLVAVRLSANWASWRFASDRPVPNWCASLAMMCRMMLQMCSLRCTPNVAISIGPVSRYGAVIIEKRFQQLSGRLKRLEKQKWIGRDDNKMTNKRFSQIDEHAQRRQLVIWSTHGDPPRLADIDQLSPFSILRHLIESLYHSFAYLVRKSFHRSAVLNQPVPLVSTKNGLKLLFAQLRFSKGMSGM